MPVVNPSEMKLLVVPSLPPAAEELYGEMRLVHATDQADKTYVLLKTAAGSLEWVQTAIG